MRAIERGVGGAATFLGKRAVVSVVGYGLTGTSGALGRVYECLARISAPPVCVSAGPLRISATIDEGKLNEAQKALHDAFVD